MRLSGLIGLGLGLGLGLGIGLGLMAESPTTRTLKRLRSDGWTAGVVEYWQPSFATRSVVDAATSGRGLNQAVTNLQKFGPGKRQDLFGFVDIVAVGLGNPRFIQCTAASGLAARVTKIVTECREEAIACLRSRIRIEAWGWRKYAKPVDRKYWRPVIKVLRLKGKAIIVDDLVTDPVTMSVVDIPEGAPF